MTDLTNEERNEKIRKQWLEVIETNESLFANLLKKENLPSEKFLEIEKRQKEGQELKKRIEDGHIPDEPPIRGYKRVNRQWVPMTEEEGDELEKDMFDLEEFGDITIDPPGGLGQSNGMSEEEYLDDLMPLRKHKRRAKRLIDKTRENSNEFLKKIKETRDKLSEINIITDEYLPKKPISKVISGFYSRKGMKDKKFYRFPFYPVLAIICTVFLGIGVSKLSIESPQQRYRRLCALSSTYEITNVIEMTKQFGMNSMHKLLKEKKREMDKNINNLKNIKEFTDPDYSVPSPRGYLGYSAIAQKDILSFCKYYEKNK